MESVTLALSTVAATVETVRCSVASSPVTSTPREFSDGAAGWEGEVTALGALLFRMDLVDSF